MKKLLLLIFFSFFQAAVFSKEESKEISGKFYLVKLNCIVANGRGLTGYAISDRLPKELNTRSYRKFVCSFYSQMVFVCDIPTGSMEANNNFNEISQAGLDSLDEQIETLNRRLFEDALIDSFYLLDSTKVYINITRITGTLQVKFGDSFLTNSKQGPFLDIQENCYKKDYQYLLKEIDRIIPVKPDNWYTIKKGLRLLKY